MKDLNFYHLTDLHYYANERIGSSGEAYDIKCQVDQKCMAESGAIIDSAFKSIIEDKETEIVLISGDLTFDGEVQSHDALKEKLNNLKANGKRVFITFATHDFFMEARKYTDEEGVTFLPKYTRAELREHYNDFGYSEAIAEHANSYSYCVQLSDDVRLLCLNDDGDFDAFCGYYNDLLFWIRDQVEDAKKAGCEIFAMTHHPLVDPAPVYPLFSHKAMLGGYEFTAPYLADLGIRYVFDGHTHIHDINYIESKKGNRLYQINTGSLTGYPLAYRKVNFSDRGMDIKSIQVDKIDWDLKGQDVLEYAKEHFVYMIKSVFESIENDYEKFLVLAQGFSGEGDKLRKVQTIMQKIGTFANRLTFAKLGKICFCSKEIDSAVADKRIVEFICDVIINMYSGKEVYSPDTPEYKSFMAIAEKLGKFIKLKDYNGNKVELTDLMSRTLYNDGIDAWNVLI